MIEVTPAGTVSVPALGNPWSLLALALLRSAYPAQGTLVAESPLGSSQYVNLSGGCIAVTSSAALLDVTDNTDGTALLFAPRHPYPYPYSYR